MCLNVYLPVRLSGTGLQGLHYFQERYLQLRTKENVLAIFNYNWCWGHSHTEHTCHLFTSSSVNLPPSMNVSGWAPNICRVIDLFVGHLFDKEPFVSHLPGSPDLHTHCCLHWEPQSCSEGPHLTVDVKLFFLARPESATQLHSSFCHKDLTQLHRMCRGKRKTYLL